MPLKIPPPPPIASKDPVFNRWLLELTSILNASGLIDPTTVDGLVALTAQVGTNTADITTLQGQVAVINGEIVTINGEIVTINGEIVTINAEVAALQARNQVLNGAGAPGAGLGNNGDLYLNNTGGAGTRLYGKIAGAWVAIA